MRIAVLPFDNLSADASQEYFADGITEALITNLAKISALRVISRTSVMQYKGAHKPLPKIARELKVGTVVEGSVMRSGDRVRITAQLIDAATDRNLWAESYERDLRDVLGLQSEVARAIAHEVEIKLTPQDELRLAGRPPVNPEVYEAYLKGRYYLNTRAEEGVKKAIYYFEQAVSKDPGWATGFAGLAQSYIVLGNISALPPKEAYPRAKEAATKALEFDVTLAEAHTSLAHIASHYDWDWSAADREFKLASRLDPNDTTTYLWHAFWLAANQRQEEAIAEIKKAQRLDPLSGVIGTGAAWCLYYARDYERAMEQSAKVLQMDPTFSFAHLTYGLACQQKSMHEEAIAEIQRAGPGASPIYLAALGHTYAKAGQKRHAEEVLGELMELSKQRYVSPDQIALVHIGLGEKDQALTWLQKACEERSIWLIYVNVDPRFDWLRSDPRFASLKQTVGLTP